MNDFINHLGDHLENLAREQERARRRRTRSRAIGGATVALAATLAAIFLIHSATPDQALARFPVLQRPITDASHIPIAPELRRNRARLHRARAFQTALGLGYAIPRDHGGLCVAIPDGSGDYALSCRDRQFVMRNGLSVSGGLVRRGIPFTLLLPSGATAPTVESASANSAPLHVDRGVASGLVPVGVTIRYRVNGRALRIPISAKSPAGRTSATLCGGQQGQARRVTGVKSGRTSCP